MNPISRKRPRINPHQFSELQTPRGTSSYDLCNSVASLASPSPLVNTDYFLSGGLDTPGAWSEQRLQRAEDDDAEYDWRSNRFFGGYTETPTTQPMTSQPRMSLQRQDSTLSGWHIRRTAWALTGGLAGKVLSFCWSTTFNGFRAGGGQAYLDSAEAVCTNTTRNAPAAFLRKRSNREIPGSYPGLRGSLEGLHTQQDPFSHSQNTSVTYNQQVSEDSVTKNKWVFIEHQTLDDQDQSPVRKRPGASVARSGSYNNPQPVQPVKNHTASFASPRSRTSSTISVNLRTNSTNKRLKPTLASPSKRQSSLAANQSSPASPEIDQYQRKRRKEDKRNDESLRRLNAQLRDMIREGQQALGSKVEVFDDQNMDEGYFDDEIR